MRHADACGTADARGGAAPLARPAPDAMNGGLPARPAPPALLRSLRVEATRLFVGAPEPAVSPYEGVARALAEGARPLLFVNPRSMDVERFVRSCGLGRPEGANEPLDHVAAECELLSYLASLAAGAPAPAGAPCGAALPGGSPQAAYAAFLDAHARRWMPAFAAAVRAEARAPFYAAAARLLAAVVERG
ncbi:molecular chaperone TorD [Eggerthella sinensis]|uniref:Molecular chaperone TorD n=2 Tax=Eggerthella sinensis TaxID=242230 RepID=A0ABX9HKX0_9ACTN|nr:molecular chaperone TorD [Eggerthella sinensis]